MVLVASLTNGGVIDQLGTPEPLVSKTALLAVVKVDQLPLETYGIPVQVEEF